MYRQTAEIDRSYEELPRVATRVVIGLCATKLLLHLFTSVRNYGYFRDELYFLDMARHLDWGYVDSAPLIAVYAKVALWMGGSLAALRILPALAGTGVVALAVLLARWMGGNRYAQFLAGLCALLSPAVVAMDDVLSMNAFEPLFWMGCIAVLIRIMRTGNSRLWLWFGLLAGLGLENKHSTSFFGFAVVAALLLTEHRREFLKPWIWIAGGIAVALFLPNVIWQIWHHFPTLEDLENVRREGKNVVLGPLAFLWQQIFVVNPVVFAVCVAGLVWLFRRKDLRVLGWTYVVLYVVMYLFHAKHYYLFPIYPMLMAAGPIQLEEGFGRWRGLAGHTWPKAAAAALVIAATVPFDLFLLPIFTPERYVRNVGFLHLEQAKTEVHHESLWPQLFADQIGWPQMAREVAAIYNSLAPEERAKTGILTGNYGEAGAINLFGPRYGLPRAYSRHQTHWYWGPPSEHYENLIVLQFSRDDVEDNCTSWQAYEHNQRFGMGEENTPIYLCRGAKFDLQKVWWHYHHWN